MQLLLDEFRYWTVNCYDDGALAGLTPILTKFGDLSIRAEWPKTKLAITKLAENARTRETALREANAKFESLDTQAVAVLAALEAQKANVASKDKARTQVPSGGILEHIVTKNPQVAADFNTHVKKSSASSNVAPKAMGRPAAKSRSRSSSVQSWKSGTLAARKSPRSRSTSRSSSRASSCKSVRFATDSGKKGTKRGKGKGGGKSNGKGRGKNNHCGRAGKRVGPSTA